MLKNYHLVLAAEREFQRLHPLTRQESLAAFEDMYQFAAKFSRDDCAPERSGHVLGLVRLAAGFKLIRQAKDNLSA